jgi:hypothetical protein
MSWIDPNSSFLDPTTSRNGPGQKKGINGMIDRPHKASAGPQS